MQVTGASGYSYLQQMQQLQQSLFGNTGTNANGSVSLDQFEAAGSANSAGSTSSADQSRMAALFSKIDTNGDGQVSQAELGSYVTNLSTETQAHMLQFQQQLFSRADSNGDGSISLAEFEGKSSTDQTSAGTTATSASDAAAAALFNKIDTNGDGKITQSELSAYMSANNPENVASASSASGGSTGTSAVHGHHHHHGGGGKSLADLLLSDTFSTGSDTGTSLTTAPAASLLDPTSTDTATDATTPAGAASTATTSATITQANFSQQIANYMQQMLSGMVDQAQNSTSGVNLLA